MIEKIDLLRNIGQFNAVGPPDNVTFSPFTLIYAENGRGKTTLAAILRSLASGDPNPINERQRLGSQHPPHIVVTHNGQQLVFQDEAWTQTVPDIAIFDDAFVTANIYSGIDLETSHRQNMHELILGAEGVTFNNVLKTHVREIEQHNVNLREKGESIPANTRGPFTVDAFCDLTPDPNIDAKMQEAKHRLAAAASATAVSRRPGFMQITLPNFDIETINSTLNQTLANLEADAAARVQTHLENLGDGGESWVADGMPRIALASKEQDADACPFCAQDLKGSALIDHYQAYFSEAYETLKARIREAGTSVRESHDGDIPIAFERDIHTASQSREFWKDFTELPEIAADTAAISLEWTAARKAVLEQLRAKNASPLEPMALSPKTQEAIRVYRLRIDEIRALSDSLAGCNAQLNVVKEQAEADNVADLTNDLNRLQAHKVRFDPAIVQLCDIYLAEKTAKVATEQRRDQARVELDDYQQQIFSTYETAINNYLERFNASFRLGQVQSVNTRGGSSASFHIVINQQNVNITADNGPSFRNTLSAGDRNTLALAFFFASLEQDANLAQKVVVVDDPITSLDEHRTSNTIREMRTLHDRTSQMIVLSHSKPFLCALWEGADTNTRSALHINRAAVGSELAEWNVRLDSKTEHDKHCKLVSDYLQASNPAEERNVAEALRPILEAFMRVAYSESFPPGTLLGQFICQCQQRHGIESEILSVTDTDELRTLLDYANQFHHDTNPAWKSKAINDAELEDFARRTLRFISRR